MKRCGIGWNRFGPVFAGDIRRQRVSSMRGFRHWRWHLDEMYVKLNGEMVYLWRAVDQEGEILESYITKTRDKAAALTFMKKALKRHGSPEVTIPADCGITIGWRIRISRSDDESEKCSASSPKARPNASSSTHSAIYNTFAIQRHLTSRNTMPCFRDSAMTKWNTASAAGA